MVFRDQLQCSVSAELGFSLEMFVKESGLSQGRTVLPVGCLQMAYLFLVKNGKIEQIERAQKDVIKVAKEKIWPIKY